MLMRTDPFRDFDRLAQQVLGTPARPAAMPIDAYRVGDEFVVEIDRRRALSRGVRRIQRKNLDREGDPL